MGDIHDSIADASRILVFQVDRIRHVVLGTAECSLATHFVGEESYAVHRDCVDAFLQMVLGGLEYRLVVSHAPNQTPYHDGS